PGATGGGDNPSLLGLTGNGNGGPPPVVLPVIGTGGNTGNGGTGGTGGSGSGLLIVPPPPSPPSQKSPRTSPATGQLPNGLPDDTNKLFVIGPNWDTGRAPTASQTAEILPVPGAPSPMIVTLSGSGIVGGLIIGSGVILQIADGGTLTVAHG